MTRSRAVLESGPVACNGRVRSLGVFLLVSFARVGIGGKNRVWFQQFWDFWNCLGVCVLGFDCTCSYCLSR